MLTQFRQHYPQGSLISELIDIDRGLYLVRVSITAAEVTLATGLAGADTIELAEDRARERAIAALGLEKVELKSAAKVESTNIPPQPQIPVAPPIEPPAVNNSTPEPQPPIAVTIASENHQPSTINTAVPEVITESSPEKPLLETSESPKNIFDQPIVETATSPEPISTEPLETEASAPVQLDFNEIRHKIDLEMKRLNWTKEQGRDYLLSTYGKRSRLHLQDDELLEFLYYLENLPNA